MVVLLVVVGALLFTLVVVLVAVYTIRPERLSLGIRSGRGVIGLYVERPFYADAGRRGPPDDPDAAP